MPVQGDNSLFFASGIDNSGLRSGALEATGIIQGLASRISSINPFVALGAGAALAFGNIAAEAFNFAKQYEAAMLEVKTISQSAQADFGQLKGDIFRLSEETLDDPIKLAQAYYQVVSAGYDGAEGLRLLETASKSAVAGVTDTLTAADGLTTIMNAFGVSAEKANEVADAMFKTVELGKTNFAQLSSSMSQAAPLAAALGVSYNEVLAAVATLTKQGTPTKVAITQIRAALVGLNRELGDGWSEIYTFQDALQELYDRADGSSTAIEKMVGQQEAVLAVLAATGKNAQGAADDLRNLEEAVGSTDRAFSAMTQGQNNALTILGNRVRALTEGLGEGLLSVANDVAQFFLNLSDKGSFAAETYQQERVQLARLRRELERGTTLQERRIEIIEELKQKYPALLQDIATDEGNTERLATAISNVNEQLLKRIRLEENKEEIAKADERLREKELEFVQKRYTVEEEIEKLKVNSAYIRERTAGDEALSLRQQVENIQKLNSEQSRTLEYYFGQYAKLGKERLQLERELNALLGEGADIRAGYVEFEEGGTPAGAETEGLKDAEQTYKEFLESMKTEYERYEAAKTVFGKEGADKRYQQLLSYGNDYRAFLAQQLSITQSIENEKVLAVKAAAEGISAEFIKQRKAAVEGPAGLADGFGNFGELAKDKAMDLPPISVEIELEEESVAKLRTDLRRVNKAIEESTDDTNRKALQEYKEVLQAQIEEKLGQTNRLADTERRMIETVQGYYLKALRERLKEQRATHAEAVKLYGRESEQAIDAMSNIRDTQVKIGDETQRMIGDISTMFRSLASLFEKFGSDDLSQLATQLAGVADGVGQMVAGFSTGNPFQIISGLAGVIDSAITIEIKADTAKFERQIHDLERVIADFNDALEDSIGIDKVKDRQELIEKQTELERAQQAAIEAEERARKEVRLLGIKLGDKGAGSGTDQKKIEGFEDAAREARREVQRLQDQVNELYTGTTSDSIVDSIVDGFEQGKDSAADFAETFEDLMRKAIIESLKLSYLEKAVASFYDSFSEAAASEDELTPAEIQALRAQFTVLVDRSRQELEALNGILEEAGIQATIGERQGLRGDIQTITEDTAGVLAGTLNKIMIDTSAGLQAALESNLWLQQIHLALVGMKEANDEANVRLVNIEKSLS